MGCLDKEKGNLSRDILQSFHTQFAENQRTREQAFLKILGFLGAVILGYAYVYDKLSQDLDKFSWVTIVSEIILMFGSILITTIAYNFRRDQNINAKIRKYCGILGEGKIFPLGFDPSESLKNKRRVFNWMPDFLADFFWMFPIFQLLILASYWTKINITCYPAFNEDLYFAFVLVISIICFISSLSFNIYYFIKVRRKTQVTNTTDNW